MEDLISIVVPVYNVEKYLRQCLDSLSVQTYQNLEIILVDDGSTDHSGEICEEYAGMDRRFCVIHQKNEGALTARKIGIQNATGTYIGFLDSDDWIAPNAYSELHDMLKTTQADMAICGVNIYDEMLNTYCKSLPVVEDGYYQDCKSKDILESLFFQKDYLGDGLSLTLWDKLFRRELVYENYERVDTRLHYFEDIALVLFCMMQAQGIVVCNTPFYYYRQRQNSLCHSVDPAYLEQVNIFYQTVYPAVSDYSEKLVERLQVYVADRAIYGLNHMMGLKLRQEVPYFLPPFSQLNPEEKIVLYGAGEVGKSYCRILEMTRPGQVVLWVDKKYETLQKEGLFVEGLSALSGVAFDKILIAVKSQDNAEAIRKDLLRMGITSEAVLWERPKTIFSF